MFDSLSFCIDFLHKTKNYETKEQQKLIFIENKKKLNELELQELINDFHSYNSYHKIENPYEIYEKHCEKKKKLFSQYPDININKLKKDYKQRKIEDCNFKNELICFFQYFVFFKILFNYLKDNTILINTLNMSEYEGDFGFNSLMQINEINMLGE